MADWKEEYLAALKELEASNPVNMDLMDQCK
jgi:hypothetical protein